GGGDASRLPRVPDRCRGRGSPGPPAGAEEDDVRSPAAPRSRRPAGEDVPGGAHGAGRGPGARAGGRPAAGPQGDDDPSRGANSSTVSVLFADQAVTTFTESPVERQRCMQINESADRTKQRCAKPAVRTVALLQAGRQERTRPSLERAERLRGPG